MLKRNIPNAITCGNLFFGCLAIVKVSEGDLIWAAYLVGIAAALDFFDGYAARLLKAHSPLGKDLDSLADMVTFGVVPGLMMFTMINWSLPIADQLTDSPLNASMNDIPGGISGKSHFMPFERNFRYLPYIAFLIPVFSAIRLAKFNNDPRQLESFIGLPTPANAILICSLPLFLHFDPYTAISVNANALDHYILNPTTLVSACVLLSLLLVSPLHLFSLKFKHYKWKGNEARYSFLIWSIVLISFLHFVGIPLVIISYVLFSLLNNLLSAKKAR